jgi:hypothetical protein
MPAILVCVPTMGFGNRLRFITCCHIYARHCGMPMRILWQHDPGCAIDLSDFSDLAERFPPVTVDEIRSAPHFLWTQHVNLLPELDSVEPAPHYLVLQGGNEFNRAAIPVRDFIAQKREFYRSIQWRIAAYPLPRERVIGIHYRNTVPRFDSADAAKFDTDSPITHFFSTLDRLPAADYFYLSTNSFDIRKSFLDRYGKRLLTAPPDAAIDSRDSSAGMRAAVADFLTLGACRCIVGTYWSSFSDEAALMTVDFAKLFPGSSPLRPYPAYGFFPGGLYSPPSTIFKKYGRPS